MTLMYIYKNLKKIVPQYIFNELKNENLERFEIMMEIDPLLKKMVNEIKYKKNIYYSSKKELMGSWYSITAHRNTDKNIKPMPI